MDVGGRATHGAVAERARERAWIGERLIKKGWQST